MIVLLSPAKRMRQQPTSEGVPHRLPAFHQQALPIIKKLASLSRPKLKALMGTSDALVETNRAHIHGFADDGHSTSGTHAIAAFYGEVYYGLDSDQLDDQDLEWADHHLRILSGLYGYLRPLDIIQPYRLEMGSKLKVGRKANLYAYWGDRITDALAADLADHQDQHIINLASKEYVSILDHAQFADQMITIHFKEMRDGRLRSIQTTMKRARGVMARQIILEQITHIEDIRELNINGYTYDSARSTTHDWQFIK